MKPDGTVDGRTPSPSTAMRRLFVAGSLALISGVCAFLFAVHPSESRLVPTCPFLLLTGLHCPGCGTLRGLHHLLHGRLASAVGLNPLMVGALPYMLGSYVGFVRRALSGAPLAPGAKAHRWAFLVPVVVVLFGILRNLPFSLFAWIRP